MIEKLPIIRLEVYMKSEHKANLQNWLGSAIRGAIGTELIKYSCCMEKKAECEKCPEILNCAVKTLYHTGSSEKSDVVINPYIIYCEKGLVNGSEICFEVILFGEGVKTYKEIIKVLYRGIKIGAERESFNLVKIMDKIKNQVIFDGVTWSELEESFLNNISNKNKVSRIKVKFLSMYNAKQKDVNAVDFSYFIRGCMRRVSATLKQNDIPLDVDFGELVKYIDNVKVVEKNLKNTTLKRYSSTTSETHEIHGVEGSITFEGEITPFLEFLKLSEIIGIGKLCVMGLGRIKVEYDTI